MTIDDLLKPKTAESYSHLTKGGNYNLELNQEEACVARDCKLDCVTAYYSLVIGDKQHEQKRDRSPGS